MGNFPDIALVFVVFTNNDAVAASVVLLASYYPAKHSLRDNTVACFCSTGCSENKDFFHVKLIDNFSLA